MEKLFSYGTLQQENVQIKTFGRRLIGKPATIAGYVVGMIKITDTDVIAASGKEYHPILNSTGNSSDKVTGIVFEITQDELNQSDNYEVSDYKRINAITTDNENVWIYAASES